MARTLQTPTGFPWRELLPHLVQPDEKGNVAYTSWLMRHRSLLSAWLLQKWCTSAMDKLALGIPDLPGVIFDELDTNKLGKLSYSQLRLFFQKSLYPDEAHSK